MQHNTPQPPVVSVLMPVYNCEKYLDLAINSIREQTFRDFEFVIVNDGSTDRSLQIIHKHAAEDGRIKLIDQPNGGIVDALNNGLAVCTGKYIARMDGDDISLPERLDKQVTYMDANPGVVGMASNVSRMYGSKYMITRGLGTDKKHDQIANQLWKGRGDALVHPATIFRTESIKTLGGYRKEAEWAEDLDIYIRLLALGELYVMQEPLLIYRQHDESINAIYQKEQRKFIRWIVEDNAKHFGKEGIPEIKFHAVNDSDQARRWSSWSHLAAADKFYGSAIYFTIQWIKLTPHDLHAWKMLTRIAAKRLLGR